MSCRVVCCAGGLAQLQEAGSTREATGIVGSISGQYLSTLFKQTPYSLTSLWEFEELGQEFSLLLQKRQHKFSQFKLMGKKSSY